MLEKFTPEEINQIKKELGMKEKLSHKQIVLKDQQDRLERLFPRRIYCAEGIGLYATKDIIDAVTLLTDHVLNNYVEKMKYTSRHKGKHYVRCGNIPEDMENEFYRVYKEFVDLIEKNNVPWTELLKRQSGA